MVYAGQGKRAEARDELEQRFWGWFEAAKIAGRLLVALARLN